MNITQQGLANGNFSILLHFLTRKTQRRKPLIDYSQSHVVISKEYMSRLWQRALEKEGIKTIRVVWKKKKDRKAS